MESLSLDKFPIEILLLIFDCCNLQDLARLAQVCKRFYEIISNDTSIWSRYYENFLVTNQRSEQFRKRCNLLLSPYSKCFVWQNWTRRKYDKKILLEKIYHTSPWLQLTNETLWWSDGHKLFNLNRKKPVRTKTLVTKCFDERLKRKQKIWRFVLWKDYVVTGYKCKLGPQKRYHGCVSIESSCYKNTFYRKKKVEIVHDEPFTALDATSNFICSASSFEYAILRIPNNEDLDSIDITRHSVTPEFFIWSLACHPSEAKLGVALAREDDSKMIYIDLEYNSRPVQEMPLYTKITNILWEDQNSIITSCGHRIDKWDLRDNTNVWSAFASNMEMNCISSDYHNTVITGNNNSTATLWDQRMSNCVQTYRMSDRGNSKKPIYSLRFDSTTLYCGTKTHLYKLDFSNPLVSTT